MNEELRLDKRQNAQIRSMHSMQGLLHNSDGSAKFSFAEMCTVLVSVNGPMEVNLKNEMLDKTTVEVIWKPLIGVGSVNDKCHESFLRTVSEYMVLTSLNPRSLLQITAQVTSEDGSSISAAINALTLCLLDAGVPMKNLVSSISCVISSEGYILLDPTSAEISDSRSFHCFVFNSVSEELIACDSLGAFTEEEYFECYDMCALACHSIQSFIRTAVERKIQHTLNLTQ